MDFSRKEHAHRAFLLRRILLVVGLALVVMVPAGLSYWLAIRGPRRISYAPEMDRKLAEATCRRLVGEVAALEKQFEQRLELGPADDETMALLQRAIVKQKAVLRLQPAAGYDEGARLQRLESALANARAQHSGTRLEELARQAAADRKAGRNDDALAKLRLAIQLQREINTSYASAGYKDLVRETSLQQEIDTLEAEPLQREVEGMIAAARAAAEQQHWAEALKAYTRAREVQMQINRDYVRTRYPDITTLDRLDAEIASLNASSLATELEAKVQAAGDALAARRWREAADHYGQAYKLQYLINQKHPRSRFVSASQLEEFEISKQSALSSDLVEEIIGLDREATRHLQRREISAAERNIALAAQRFDNLLDRYPKSREIDNTLKLKVSYLQLHHAELGTMQDQLLDQLVPVPGMKDLLMLKTELPQSLYSVTMNGNPSHNFGRTLPVDSVSWNEAQECCRRLGWIIGRTVRLPDHQEFRAAVGPLEGLNLDAIAWSEANSALKSQPVGRSAGNGAGFNDLLGNLAEWLQPDVTAANPTVAPVAGGSYQDSAGTLRSMPVTNIPKDKRMRTIGFRVVVEFVPEPATGPAAK